MRLGTQNLLKQGFASCADLNTFAVQIFEKLKKHI